MKERIITGIIAALLFIGVTVYGKLPFTLVIIALAVIGLQELLRMKKITILSVQGLIGLLLTLATVIPENWKETYLGYFSGAEPIVLALLLILVVTVITKNRFTFDDAGFVILSSLYVGYGFHYILETRLMDQGLPILFFILFMIWGADSGAYFTGKSVGKTKLWPVISPNKTVEGAVGGIITSIAVGLLCYALNFIPFTLSVVILMAVIAGIFGQIGDLAQSAFKRHYGVKDSGNLLPGHGGILDRTDSWLFVLPLLHILHLLA
ncbi:phosphatidate cytidylyltransferase [Fictibacillus sp. KIGAM418]|uniref:Phosphatidate cytidylyltransferase n=1 Tax=Fictibacillus marinisediminis TaxID=2878389 RepID=A0A9X1XAN6_9BACL|nr:phosphatidate cytidylyltransferase [Fictibacillus marinisediminis]MCK6257043.1 phosphatidate cytidylyltransferase [Fictibacillus marinisediminis]